MNFTSNSEKATADVLVGGTLSGGDAPVIFNSYNSPIDNLAKCISLTAWRIIPNINGDVVELDYYSSRHPEMKEEFEKKIMYIIKVEQPTGGGTISVSDKDGNALATSHDYEVANEGDIVKINPEKGYKLPSDAGYPDKPYPLSEMEVREREIERENENTKRFIAQLEAESKRNKEAKKEAVKDGGEHD